MLQPPVAPATSARVRVNATISAVPGVSTCEMIVGAMPLNTLNTVTPAWNAATTMTSSLAATSTAEPGVGAVATMPEGVFVFGNAFGKNDDPAGHRPAGDVLDSHRFRL